MDNTFYGFLPSECAADNLRLYQHFINPLNLGSVTSEALGLVANQIDS